MFRFEFVIVVVALLMPISISGLNLADTECGLMNEGSRRYFQRILGGSVADITDFPYTISLKLDGKHFCGGSLINRNFVITAAHCVEGYVSAGRWSITVGEQNRGIPEDHEQSIQVMDIVTHKDFRRTKASNDIAIVRLSSPVQWNDHAQPVCLPDSEEEFGGNQGILAGWGSSQDVDPKVGKPEDFFTEELNFARLPIIDSTKCQQIYDKYNEENKKHIKITGEQICAGHEEGRIDGCKGDSGGGLISTKEHRMVMVGVMSGGVGCGRPNIPGVYTSISRYVKWINETITNWDTPGYRLNTLHWTGADSQQVLRLRRQIEQPITPDEFQY